MVKFISPWSNLYFKHLSFFQFYLSLNVFNRMWISLCYFLQAGGNNNVFALFDVTTVFVMTRWVYVKCWSFFAWTVYSGHFNHVWRIFRKKMLSHLVTFCLPFTKRQIFLLINPISLMLHLFYVFILFASKNFWYLVQKLQLVDLARFLVFKLYPSCLKGYANCPILLIVSY